MIAGQVFLGDMLYATMLHYQPAKIQAAEGFWEKESQSPAPYYRIIFPDQEKQRNLFALGVPYRGSIWLTHSLDGRFAGLKNTPPDRQPEMGMVFYGFHVMYGLAITMFGLGCASPWLRWQRRLFTTRWFLRALVIMTPSGILTTIAGWDLAETGRQPWVIYGILRTADAISPVPAGAMLSSLIAIACIYTLFISGFPFFTCRIIRRGPQAGPAEAEGSGLLKPALTSRVMDNPAVAAAEE